MSRFLLSTPVTLGAKIASAGILGLGLSSKFRKPILNDTPSAVPASATYPAYSSDKRLIRYEDDIVTRRGRRFGGYLDYQQLSVGSFTGLLSGYIVGKISKLLVFLTVTGLLTIQYLQSRGIITRRSLPMLGDMARYAQDKVDVTEFMLDQPSFKISFLSSFIIAACYA